MRKTTSLFVAATIASFAAGAAMAQSTTFANVNAAEDAIDDLREAIDDDNERDIEPFGNVGRPIGFDGSFALRGQLSSGNTESADLGLGANLGYYDGANGYRLLLAYTYGEEDGIETEARVNYGLEYTRDFGERWYGYAQIQGVQDDYGSFTRDTFAGFGVGYKLIERSDLTWYISGGPGYRWAETAAGLEIEEEALSLNSNYTARLSDTVLGTLDTTVIHSESDTVIYNDAGINVSLNDSLALRTSLTSEFHTDPAPGSKDLDNVFGVSLVYSFN